LTHSQFHFQKFKAVETADH